ncbi:hypothetical protein VQ056_11710 [Paenibacillus sp. JTLBN-2024]
MFQLKYGLVNQLRDLLRLAPVDWYSAPGYWVASSSGSTFGKIPGMPSFCIWPRSLASTTNCTGGRARAAQTAGKHPHITLPLLVPTITIVTLLAVGKIFYGDFQTIYSIVGDNGLLYETTDVIDTYVFRAVKNVGDISMPAAVGLYQSVCGFLFVLGCNWAVKKINNDNALF